MSIDLRESVRQCLARGETLNSLSRKVKCSPSLLKDMSLGKAVYFPIDSAPLLLNLESTLNAGLLPTSSLTPEDRLALNLPPEVQDWPAYAWIPPKPNLGQRILRWLFVHMPPTPGRPKLKDRTHD